ncbi:MAG: hypothetical protein R3C68_19460 [Myxococcota bacterium]
MGNAIRSGTSWSNPITVSAYDTDTVTIVPTPGAAAFWFKSGVNMATIQYWIIKGFTIDGDNQALHGIKLQNAPADSLAPSDAYAGPHYIRVSNSEIMNMKASGLLVGGDDHEFLNLKVHDCGTTFYDHGIYLGRPQYGCAIRVVQQCGLRHSN